MFIMWSVFSNFSSHSHPNTADRDAGEWNEADPKGTKKWDKDGRETEAGSTGNEREMGWEERHYALLFDEDIKSIQKVSFSEHIRSEED